MCGQVEPLSDLVWTPAQLLHLLYPLKQNRTIAFVGGRGFGHAQREFQHYYQRARDLDFRAEYYGNFTPDDRPIGEVVRERYWDAIGRSERASIDDHSSLRVSTALRGSAQRPQRVG